jgi:hypothetical protein
MDKHIASLAALRHLYWSNALISWLIDCYRYLHYCLLLLDTRGACMWRRDKVGLLTWYCAIASERAG